MVEADRTMKIQTRTSKPPMRVLSDIFGQRSSLASRGTALFLIEQLRARNSFAFEYHALNTLDLLNLFQRISVHQQQVRIVALDRKSTRLNSSHLVISYAVF